MNFFMKFASWCFGPHKEICSYDMTQETSSGMIYEFVTSLEVLHGINS